MKTLEIKHIDNLEEAKNAWNKLSPDKTICDNWDFNYCAYKYFNYPLYFYAGYDNEEMVGLLPLQYNENEKCLEFFSGGFMRDNRIFIKQDYGECIPQFYNAITKTARLIRIMGEDPFTKSLNIYKYKYIANLSQVKDPDDYLVKKFSKESRYKVRKKIKSIELLSPQIVENNYNDLDLMIELNKKNFGEKSSFNKPHRAEIFRDLLKLNFDIHMLTFVINSQKEAVSFSIKYKNVYAYIQTGTNKNAIPNLGTYNIYKNFEKAINFGAKYLDAGVSDLGWKERWHLEKIPQYLFIKE